MTHLLPLTSTVWQMWWMWWIKKSRLSATSDLLLMPLWKNLINIVVANTVLNPSEGLNTVVAQLEELSRKYNTVLASKKFLN
jgi:hypothetical protein